MKLVDLQRLDVGIGMSHFELSVREMGLKGEWAVRDPGLSGDETNRVYIATWLG
jgi:hypothetical protein